MSKTKKYILYIAAALLVGALVYYFFFSKKAKADKPYVDLPSGPAYTLFFDAVKKLTGKTDIYADNLEGKIRGYLKLNGYAMTPKNLELFSAEIMAYVADPSTKPHWEVLTA